MNKEEVNKKLLSIENNSQYLRVSDVHPLELYLGKSENGLYTLRFNGNFAPQKIAGSKVIEIKQIQTSQGKSLLFSLISNEFFPLFCDFCADLITNTENYKGGNAYIDIINRYNQWKKMFYTSSNILNENEILGLIGELLFLRDFAMKKYGVTNGLNGWSGPEPTHKDFSFNQNWFEIKSLNSFRNSVQISSIEQLDGDGTGYLVVYKMEKMSPNFDGLSLNKLVRQILDSIELDSDKDLFIEKLKKVGYSYNDSYDCSVYNLITKDSFIVNDDFPRFRASQLPKGIGKIQYEILLPLIEKFKVEL